MKTSLRTLIVFALSIFACSVAQAQNKAKSTEIYESAIKEEQRVANFTISSANNDLEQASVAYSRNMNNLAWVYITDCGVKLDGIKGKLKGHEERIAKARNFFGFGLSMTTRQKHLDAYFRIKDNITKAYVKMNAVEKDVGTKLGIDVSWVRQMLSALKAACESTGDQAFCDAYQRAKAAIESGNISEVNRILSGIYGKLDAVKDSDPAIEVPSAPAASSSSSVGTGYIGGTSNISSSQMDELASAVEALQDACASGNQAACEKLALIQKQIQDGNMAGAYATLNQMKNDPATANLFGGSSSASTYGAAPSSGKLVLTDESGKELVFIDGNAIKRVYAGKRLKTESVLKLTDVNANPPYEVVSTRNWDFTIQSTQKQASATAYVMEFRLVEQGGRDEYTVSNWAVTDASGAVIASGADLPFEVNFTASGTYYVEISGQTDMGSEFTIRSSIQVAL
ncbi:MAG: hypothetical protein JW942_09110 [Opitutales bacterium]|nr:hypothetical protein [Opitutales bacterium]